MAIRPEISLQLKHLDVGGAINNALLNAQRIQGIRQSKQEQPIRNQLLQAQVDRAEQANTQAQEKARLASLVTGAAELSPLIADAKASGDLGPLVRSLHDRRARLIAEGAPNTRETDEAFAMLGQGPKGLDRLGQATTNLTNLGFQTGILKPLAGATGLASAKTEFFPDGSSLQGLPSGETVAKDSQGRIVTGSAREELFKASSRFALDVEQKQADIAVRKAERTANATNRAARVSAVTGQMNDRNRAAKRGEINLSQAATLVEQAAQGIEGVNKVRLAKVFPGIDVSNEAALSQSLTNLALDELQKFKGPTTDFEFGKTEEIAGTLGDSKSANRAKIASLRRANWFNQRESKQFQDHVKNGGDPDAFGFNFGEPVKTKKGVFTLKDLQDTAVANNISIDEALKRLNK
jgi:hypothetical protein